MHPLQFLSYQKMADIKEQLIYAIVKIHFKALWTTEQF
jgi:hypothetical protein